MNDRTLLQLVLVLAVVSLAINGSILTELKNQALMTPTSGPPPNSYTSQTISQQANCRFNCMSDRKACMKPCASCSESWQACKTTCRNEVNTCKEPCAKIVEEMIEDALPDPPDYTLIRGEYGYGKCRGCAVDWTTCVKQCDADMDTCQEPCTSCYDKEIECEEFNRWVNMFCVPREYVGHNQFE